SGAAAVAVVIGAVVTLLELDGDVAVTAVRAEHAARGAFAVAAVVVAVVALLEFGLHHGVAAVRAELAVRRAPAVRAVVDAVVADLSELVLNDAVAAARSERALGRALVVLARVVRAVVALFAGTDLAVAAVGHAVARPGVEAGEREHIGGTP